MDREYKLLLVDDDRDFQKTLADLLKQKKYGIFQASTGKKAQQLIQEEDISLVITDLSLPDMSGLDLIQSVKQESPNTEFIILTGLASQQTAIQAVNLGVFAYYKKPVDVDQLLLSIEQALQKHQAFIQLSESQAKYKKFFENASVAMFRTNLDGSKFLDFNQAFCDLLGYTHEELMTHEPISLWIDADASKQESKSFYEAGFGASVRLEIRKKDGTIRHCLASFNIFSEEDFIEGWAIDLTDRLTLEERLQESENRFFQAFNASPYAIAMNRLSDGMIINVNDAFTDILGYKREEVINRLSNDLNIWVDPQDRDRALSDLYQNQNILNRECEFRHKNGEIFTGLLSVDPNMVFNGERYMLASVVDVTPLKHADQAIRKSASTFKWLYENAPVPYHILSPDGTIKDVNQRWCEVLGFTKEEAIGHKIFDFISPEERADAMKSFDHKKTGHQNFIAGSDRSYVTKNGDIRIFTTYDYFVYDQDGHITSIQTTIEDITERKKTELEDQRKLERMRSMIDILQYPAGDEKEFLNFALEEAVKLTQSKVGFIHTVGGSLRNLNINSFTPKVPDFIPPIPDQSVQDLQKNKLFREIIRQNKCVIVNDPKDQKSSPDNYPKDHIRLNKYLVVPIANEGKVEAIVGVANKESDYTETDQLQLSLLMDSVWKSIDRWQAIRALSENEIKLRNLMNASEDLVVLKDSQYRHIMVNQAAVNRFEKSESEILGKTDYELTTKEYADSIRKSDVEAIKTNKVVSSVEKYGDRFYEARKFPVPIRDQTGVGGFIRDVTAQIQNEKLVKQKTKEITSLYEMGIALSQTTDLNVISQTAYEFVRKLADCPAFTISLINREKQTLEALFSISDNRQLDVATIFPHHLSKKCRTGRCGAINIAQPIIVAENVSKPCEHCKPAGNPVDQKSKPYHSGLFIPMVIKSKVIGLLELKSHQKNAYSQEIAEVLVTAANQIGLSIDNSRFLQTQKLQTTALNSAANAIIITDPKGVIEWANPAFTKLTGYSLSDIQGHMPNELFKSNVQEAKTYKQLWATVKSGKIWKGVLVNRRKDGSQYIEELIINPVLDDNKNITHFIGIKQDVTTRELRERELTVVANVSSALRIAETRAEMLPVILDQLIEQLRVEAATIVMHDPVTDEMVIELGRGLWANSTGLRIPPGIGLSRQILDSKKEYLNNGNQKVAASFYSDEFLSCQASAAVPLITQDKGIGVIYIGSNRMLDERDMRLLKAVADIAANAIYRASLHEKTYEKVNQLDSLRVIDQAINTSMDLKVTLKVILKQSLDLLKCDAMVILLSKPQTMLLEPVSSIGFQTKDIDRLRLHISEGLPGQSILDHHIVSSDSLKLSKSRLFEKSVFDYEKFQTYHSAPLFVKGDLKGVMLIFNRKPFTPMPEWLDVVNTLATQAAIAINNNELFDSLQRSTLNLTVAYNETIEGWAKALELRDQETEGHSKRVTELTIKFAYEMGFSDEAIGNIMRGSLLHDIGKMGIPDAILNKPGKLTEEEWALVREHPQDAYIMLSKIEYLKSALDIPYCHHERWDGTGYPRGLKGVEIPLAARIFAVVDVWDALTSNRPYRKAWSRSKAKEYMRSQAGKHFDPSLVEIFFQRVLNEK
ncbi:MAG: hypothetical protein PWQ55_1458 [Chloroflexota bacterium]|nr:hypothetical protein [Chloroflexota bacterium]